MKKRSFIFVFSLLLILCFSSVSYSRNDYKLLTKYRDELDKNYDKMRVNNKRLMQVMKTTKYRGYDIYSKFAALRDDLLWSYDMITLFGITYRLRNHESKMITKRLIYIQEGIQIGLVLIDKIYDYIKADSLLHVVEEQRAIIRSSLETLDKAIKLMKIMARKQTRNK
jgi:hypothetical protein